MRKLVGFGGRCGAFRVGGGAVFRFSGCKVQGLAGFGVDRERWWHVVGVLGSRRASEQMAN